MKKFLNLMKEKEISNKNVFLISLTILLIYCSLLIFSDVPYMDDQTRMDNGFGGFESEGRPLTTLLIVILNFSFLPIYNIAPIPLIVGLVFFSYCIMYVYNNMDIKKNLFNIIPFLFLICNPFFLQNLSYQFDSIGNIFSVGLILLSFFYKNNSKIKMFIAQTFFLFLVYCSYQPTSNMYIAIFMMNLFFQYKNTNNNFTTQIKWHFGVYFLATILYFIGIKIAFHYMFQSIAFRSDLIDLSVKGLSYSIIFSIHEFLDLCIPLKDEKMFFLVKIAVVFYFINIFIQCFKHYRNKELTNKNKRWLIIFLLFSPIIFTMSLWGPFILLQELFFNPRDFPVMGIAFMMLSLFVGSIDTKGYIRLLYLITLSLALLGFSFVYGKSLKWDNIYKTYLYNDVATKIESNSKIIGNKEIDIYGRNGTSSFVRLSIAEHPFIYRIMYQDNMNFFKKYNIGARNIKNIKGGFMLDNLDEWKKICATHIKPFEQNSNYEMFDIDNHISIWFKRTPVFCDNYPLETDIHFSRKEGMYRAGIKVNIFN